MAAVTAIGTRLPIARLCLACALVRVAAVLLISVGHGPCCNRSKVVEEARSGVSGLIAAEATEYSVGWKCTVFSVSDGSQARELCKIAVDMGLFATNKTRC